MIKISYDVAQSFGGPEKIAERVDAFIKAIEAHRQTENVPAPTEVRLIDAIVRGHGGKFEVLEPEPIPEPEPLPNFPITPEPEPEPELNLVDWRNLRLAELVALRNERRSAGVQYGANWYWSDIGSLTELVIAKDIARDDPNYTVKWKTRDGEFVILGAKDFTALVQLMRSHTQTCFNKEASINTKIRSYSLPKLASLNVVEMWDAE